MISYSILRYQLSRKFIVSYCALHDALDMSLLQSESSYQTLQHACLICCTIVNNLVVPYDPCYLQRSVVQGFDRVKPQCQTHEKLITMTLLSMFPLELSCWRTVEPPQTHVKLHPRPGSLCCIYCGFGKLKVDPWTPSILEQ